MKISATIPTSEVKNIPNDEYVNIMLHSQRQCKEAQDNGFELLYMDYAGHLLPYIQVKRSDIMKIHQ